MNAGRGLFGAVLAALGVVLLLDTADVLDAGRVVAAWWPVTIVLLGVLHVVSVRRAGGAGIALILIGLALLGVTTGLFGSDAWRFVWPAALIGVGVWLTFGWGRRLGSRPSDDDVVDGIAVLGSARLATRSKAFRRASVTTVLGGVTLDLSQAAPVPAGGEVSITAVLGGVKVLVPRGWVVEVRGLPILGSWDDTTDRQGLGPGSPRLEVQALVVLGGVEVKHPARWK